MKYEAAGRPFTTKWPGLETKRNMPREEANYVYTRSQEIDMEIKEAAEREKEYLEADIDIDIDNLKFSCDPSEKHTTIDLISINDESQRARITTNDYVVYNRIKKLMAAADRSGNGEWLIEDLKLNQTRNAVFFITVTCPLLEVRKIFNRHLQNRHESLDNN